MHNDGLCEASINPHHTLYPWWSRQKEQWLLLHCFHPSVLALKTVLSWWWDNLQTISPWHFWQKLKAKFIHINSVLGGKRRIKGSQALFPNLTCLQLRTGGTSLLASMCCHLCWGLSFSLQNLILGNSTNNANSLTGIFSGNLGGRSEMNSSNLMSSLAWCSSASEAWFLWTKMMWKPCLCLRSLSSKAKLTSAERQDVPPTPTRNIRNTWQTTLLMPTAKKDMAGLGSKPWVQG